MVYVTNLAYAVRLIADTERQIECWLGSDVKKIEGNARGVTIA